MSDRIMYATRVMDLQRSSLRGREMATAYLGMHCTDLAWYDDSDLDV
jgi:hypothetical protein